MHEPQLSLLSVLPGPDLEVEPSARHMGTHCPPAAVLWHDLADSFLPLSLSFIRGVQGLFQGPTRSHTVQKLAPGLLPEADPSWGLSLDQSWTCLLELAELEAALQAPPFSFALL